MRSSVVLGLLIAGVSLVGCASGRATAPSPVAPLAAPAPVAKAEPGAALAIATPERRREAEVESAIGCVA